MSNLANTLRVATFNMRYGTADDGADSWHLRNGVVMNTLRALDADILGTQEGLPFQLEELDTSFPKYSRCGLGRYHGVLVDRPHEAYSGEHCAVFYRRARFELLSADTSWLSETPEIPGSCHSGANLARIITRAVVREIRTDRILTVLNTHYHWGAPVTAASTTRLAELLIAVPESHTVIVTGDFNLPPDSAEHTTLLATPLSGNRRLIDAWQTALGSGSTAGPRAGTSHGFTGTAMHRIDWILVSNDVEVTRAAIDDYHEQGRYPSDHFPVYADLRL
jgi:endonuclease/exonuclease/phosphatase family metal-dependent hydrolase